MKKFYAIALATSVALGASAEKELTLRSDILPKSAKELKTAPYRNATRFIDRADVLRAAAARKVAKAGEAAFDIEGNYTGTFGDYYFQSSVGGLVEEACVAEITSGYFVLDSDYFITNIVAPYDAATYTISLNAMDLGPVTLDNGASYYYARIEPFEYDWALNNGQGGIAPKDYTVTFDPATGKIAFPADHGISWAVYKDQYYKEWAGYLDAFDIVSLQRVDENADPDQGWTSLGDATLMDGWLLPALGIDQTDPANWYKVELQQNDANKNVYRLVDPYKGNCPVADMNSSTKRGYIQFDVTDPDHVTFATVDACVVNANADLTKFYCHNVLTFLAGYYSLSTADVISMLGDDMPFTTFKDGVLTLSSGIAEDGSIENDAVFGDQYETYGGYGWQDEEGKPVNMEARIYFPGYESGIEDVVAAPSDASAVKYYNLQGQPVASPAAGTLVIRQIGDKVEKVIVR